MVDFRYHLVSLIAVFMALAVGVVLGAGPLQNSLGRALNDQVESLRDSRDQARIDADEANQRASAYESGLETLAPEMVADTLTGQSVLLVSMPGASAETVERHRANLIEAGASVTGSVEITEEFFSAERATYRNALAGQLGSYVEPADSPIGTLARGLEFIATTDAQDPGAATLTELFKASDNALIEVTETLTAPATAILVIGPADEDVPAEAETVDETVLLNKIEFLSAIDTPMVFAGNDGTGTLLEALRAGDADVSTVDTPDDATALINVPFALTQELSDSTVTWGVGQSAELVLGSPVELALEPGAEEGEGTAGDPPNENPVEPTADES